jgi:hypothetical protein
MAPKPIPNRCIWCLEEPPSATFKSESHVLPECVGNEQQQVLPPGIVCDGCNQFFGRKVEPTLIDDPIFSTRVGILQLRDKSGEFVYEPSPSGVHRNIHVDAKVSGNKITVATTQYEIQGQPSKPYENRSIPPKSKDYNKRALALLSRAVHKVAFESLAHSLFVGTGLEFEIKELKDIDMFDQSLKVIRDWVRYGEPQHSVRTVLRLQEFEGAKKQKELTLWKFFLYGFQNWLRMELDLFGDWYIMSLTSSPDKVESDLKIWSKKIKSNNPVWMVGDKLQPID